MQAQPVSIPPQNITAHVPGIDPAQVADTSVQAFDFSVRFIAEVPIGWVRDLLSIGNIWTQTPAALVYEQPAIQVLRPTMLGVAFGLLALVLLVAGLRRTLGQSLHPGRILYAVVLAVGAPVWWQIGVDLNNAICSS